MRPQPTTPTFLISMIMTPGILNLRFEVRGADVGSARLLELSYDKQIPHNGFI
jgi:hypothetical protein